MRPPSPVRACTWWWPRRARAGSARSSPRPLEEWQRILDVNLTGTFLTLKHAGAALVRSGGGAMVAISSIAGTSTHRYYGPYNVSKAGVDMLVRTTADELGMSGVRVCSVRPGLVETDLVTPILGDEAIVGDYLDQMPVRRLGQVDDVAALVRFLLDDEAGWITGVTVSVDGGHHLRRGPNLEPHGPPAVRRRGRRGPGRAAPAEQPELT